MKKNVLDCYTHLRQTNYLRKKSTFLRGKGSKCTRHLYKEMNPPTIVVGGVGCTLRPDDLLPSSICHDLRMQHDMALL